MRKMLHCLTLAAALVLTAPNTAQAQGTAGPILRPGDRVDLVVWRRPELSGSFDVTLQGTVNHPLLNDVQVAGVTLETAWDNVNQRLLRYEERPQFTITPLLRVVIGGEVRQPSLYTLAPQTTIAEAVASAGGVTVNARLDKVRLVRGGQTTVLDLTAVDATLETARIRSGDQIFVERKVSVFRDYIAPAGSIASAVVGLLNLIL
jgi:polysaccharide biosynthesis/export protein